MCHGNTETMASCLKVRYNGLFAERFDTAGSFTYHAKYARDTDTDLPRAT